MTRSVLPPSRLTAARDAYRAFAVAVDHMREGEQVVALVNPDAVRTHPSASSIWLGARLTIGELARRFLPRCDERCTNVPHEAHAFVALANLSLDPAEPRRATWWEGWTDSLQREQATRHAWYAGAPELPATPQSRRLAAGTRLHRLTVTDPYWVHYDTLEQETLYEIVDGPHAGDALVAASFGLSPLMPALAGALIAPDHPPVRDPATVRRMLAAGWDAVERALPFEE